MRSSQLALKERESRIIETIKDKEAQINLLQSQLHECQSQLQHAQLLVQSHPAAIQAAVHNREAELRILVLSREEDLGRAIQRKEREIMSSLQRREAEVNDSWGKREGGMRAILSRNWRPRNGSSKIGVLFFNSGRLLWRTERKDLPPPKDCLRRGPKVWEKTLLL